jgi:hypothetical protein
VLEEDETDIKWLVWAGMVAYVSSFAIAVGPGPWVVSSEIYELNVRSTANALCTAGNWTACLIVSMVVLLLAESSAGIIALWLVFAGFAIFCWFWVYLRLPETAGKTLEEIKYLFDSVDIKRN